MTVGNIVDVIEKFAPLNLAESYDNSGLLIGRREKPISKLLVCVDVTEEIVAEAINIGAEMILSHHPLIFSGLKQLCGSNYIERAVESLIKNDISLYCAHTSIDATFSGISFKMGEKLGLIDMEVLSIERDGGEGFGVVGNLPKSLDVEKFLLKVKKLFGCGVIRHTKPHKSTIQRVALCGGSGSSFMKKAVSSNADIYISADFKYHDFFNAENQIIMADIGHFESEQVVLDIFCDIISKKYSNFAVCKTLVNSNPIIYL